MDCTDTIVLEIGMLKKYKTIREYIKQRLWSDYGLKMEGLRNAQENNSMFKKIFI